MRNQRIHDVLKAKGQAVWSVAPLAAVIDAVAVMNDHRIGAVMVLEGDSPIGILSERDVLVRVVAAERDPKTTRVRDVMTTRLHTASADDLVLDVMQLMTERRCRHVPVMEGDHLVGLVSIGDLTKATQERLRQEVRELSSYIGGPYMS